MDRSFLSDQAVVQASRAFICIRLSTYEDQGEADFMTSTYRFRGNLLKNSMFAILDSSAKKHLAKPGRSPKRTYRDGAEMAAAMRVIAKKYPAKKIPKRKGSRQSAQAQLLGLPFLKSVHLALNVTACDSQRLVIIYGKRASQRKALEKELVSMAWSDAIIGKFLYAQCSDPSELEGITSDLEEACVLVVDPGTYGLKGVVLESVTLARVKELKKTLLAATANAQGSKDSKRQIGRGRRRGIRWETEIEVADKSQVDPSKRRRRRR